MSKILSSLVFWALVPGVAFAQITPDSSLGEEEKSVVDINGNRDTINGGAVRNANLFHSFQEFNVDALREAYFSNPDGINNIFSRVTGNNISDIQGVLGVLGNANLFLINPNGILFGENARLDVNGSFFATTADSVLFENGFEFSAVNPSQPPLLKIDIPIGLRFRDNPGDITNTQGTLSVNSDSTIGLLGGNLVLEDATIQTPGGRIELGSIAQGEINFIEVANGFSVDYSAVETFGDISLSGRSDVNASGEGGGDIQVAGKKISLTGVSGLISDTSGANSGGDINILATDSLEISGVENEDNFVSAITNRVLSSATADGGDINIEARSLRLGDRASIDTFVSGQGNAGNIKINASEGIFLTSQGNDSGIFAFVNFGAIGNGGNITINTGFLSLTTGTSLNASTLGQGNAGNININAKEGIFLDASSDFLTLIDTGIDTSVGFSAMGNGGDIIITTPLFSLSNGAILNASTSGEGNAGNITINASNSGSVGGSLDTFTSIDTGVNFDAVGNGGDITITTPLFSFSNGALSASTSGQGNAGNININASDGVFLDASPDNLTAIATFVNFGAIGNGGDITITTSSFSLSNGAFIIANTAGRGDSGNIAIATEQFSLTNEALLNTSSIGQGNSGNISILATDTFVLDNSSISSNLGNQQEVLAIGTVGNIFIEAREISLTNTAKIQTRLFSGAIGESGTIVINAQDSISLVGENTGLFSNTVSGGLGDASDINLTTKSLIVSDGAILSTSNPTLGQGGNIRIDASDSVSFTNGSGIFARALEGNSGNIELNTGSLTFDNEAILSTSNPGLGQGGNITINATDKITFTNNSDIFVGASEGDSGDIDITANSLIVSNEVGLFARNSGRGKGGNVRISATDNVSFTNNSSILVTGSEGGSINISAKNLSLINDSAFFAGIDIDSGFAEARSGNVVINLTEDLILDGLDGEVITSIINNNVGMGNAGNIEISARNISLTNGGNVASFSNGLGNTGDIILNATENIAFDGNSNSSSSGIQSLVTETGEGVSGNITIDAKNLSLTNGASIATQVAGSGNSGNISINVKDSVTIDGETEELELLDGTVGILTSSIRSIVGGSGNSGDINLTTQNLTMTKGGNIFASIVGQGRAGNINLTTNNISLDGRGSNTASSLESSVLVDGIGDGGNIEVATEQFSLTNGALLSTSSAGQGNAGNIFISVTDTFVANDSLITSNIGSPQEIPAAGKVGNIFIEAKEISFTDTAQIQAGSFPGATVEQPGIVSLTATESISFTDENTGIASNVEAGAVGNGSDIQLLAPSIFLSDGTVFVASNAGEGNGGNIEIITEQFSLTNGSGLTTSSLGQGDAGNIFISATDTFFATRSLVLSNIGSPQGVPAVGKVGNIFIEARKISLTDGAQLQAGFFSQASGESGLVSVQAEDSISFTGENTGIFSNTEVEALGNASDIKLSAPSIFLGDGAVLIADNAGEGNGGNIELDANELQMNQGKISAATAFGTGGKINFQITDNLILQNNSLISARATNKADGGNVNIDSRFLVAFPNQNNDIIASAELGTGGNIDITAEAIFGIEERSSTPPNKTNDIDASSQFGFSGTVNITQPDVNPTSGLLELTQDVVDPAKLIAQNVCTQTANSEFVDIGKGGLPKNPEYTLTADTIEVGLVAPIIPSSETTEPATEREEVKPKKTRQPPAQGWIWHENGMVELVAYNPNQVSEQRTWDNHRGCQN